MLGIEIGSLRTNPLTQNDWTVVVLIASSVFIIEEFETHRQITHLCCSAALTALSTSS